MSNPLNEEDKEFLTLILNECTNQIRAKCLYAIEDEIHGMVKNVKHLKEIGEKLNLKII